MNNQHSASPIAEFVTGYEPHLDFSWRAAAPKISYLIATVPRTGSTLLSHLLWQTGRMGAPLEYLNFDPHSHYPTLARNPDAQLQHWERVLRSRTSHNGVFGCKVFLMQLLALRASNPVLLDQIRPHRIIYLARRDFDAHCRSYARAAQSGIWCAEQEDGSNLPHNRQDLSRAACWIRGQSSGWERVFDRLGVAPLRLWYEDVAAQPHATAVAVGSYLGVDIGQQVSVAVPEVRRQHSDEARV